MNYGLCFVFVYVFRLLHYPGLGYSGVDIIWLISSCPLTHGRICICTLNLIFDLPRVDDEHPRAFQS